MADKKISQLSAASTPLAGTEVLPIVQSSTTVKVATDDLTVKNIRSNATTGILQVAGPAAAATRTMTVPDANFTVARTDAAQAFTGDQTLSTGNVVVGTAGKGVDFSINTHAAGMTSELLNDYEEGTWTPNQGAGLVVNGTFSSNGTYTKVGRLVSIHGQISATVDLTASGALCSNLPYAPASNSTGTYLTGAAAAAGILWAGGSAIYTVSPGISATTDVWFCLTYQV
jgi:hypothetical protein